MGNDRKYFVGQSKKVFKKNVFLGWIFINFWPFERQFLIRFSYKKCELRKSVVLISDLTVVSFVKQFIMRLEFDSS